MTFRYEQPPEKYSAWRGLALPFIRKKGGYFKSETIENLIWSSITVLMSTSPGEVLGDREFGTLVKSSLFEQNTNILRVRLSNSIMDAVAKYEPRIRIKSINVRVSDNNESVLEIYIIAQLTNTDIIINRGFRINRFQEFKIVEVI